MAPSDISTAKTAGESSKSTRTLTIWALGTASAEEKLTDHLSRAEASLSGVAERTASILKELDPLDSRHDAERAAAVYRIKKDTAARMQLMASILTDVRKASRYLGRERKDTDFTDNFKHEKAKESVRFLRQRETQIKSDLTLLQELLSAMSTCPPEDRDGTASLSEAVQQLRFDLEGSRSELDRASWRHPSASWKKRLLSLLSEASRMRLYDIVNAWADTKYSAAAELAQFSSRIHRSAS